MRLRPLAAANAADPDERVTVMAVVSDVDGITEYRLHDADGTRLRRVDAYEDTDTGKLYRRLGA